MKRARKRLRKTATILTVGALVMVSCMIAFGFLILEDRDASADGHLSGLPGAFRGSETDTVGPVVYRRSASDGEYGFTSIPAHRLKAKLIPNLEQREKNGMTTISGVAGVAHFFLDHDLTTGFVHPYTQSMFSRLRPDDYVLRFDRLPDDASTGHVQYIFKKNMQPEDVLGNNIGFFRQWRLSEFDLKRGTPETKIRLRKCSYASGCGCPQTPVPNNNPYEPQIPLWSKTPAEGFVPLSSCSNLGQFDGGTVVIIWEVNEAGNSKTMFQDVHGSLEQVVSMAIQIADKYGVDPHIGISDAGPFARKVRANGHHELDCAALKKLSPNGAKFGAGFGYLVDV